MAQSGEIDKLAQALSQVQSEIRGAVKNKTNPHFKSEFADLESVIEASQDQLSKHGLAIVQMPDIKDGQAILTTILMHISGQWISGDYLLSPIKTDPQSLVAATTYARRTARAACLGIPQTDDDGEKATGRTDVSIAIKPKNAVITGPQVRLLWAKKNAAGLTDMQYRKLLHDIGGVTRSEDIEPQKLDLILSAINKQTLKDINGTETPH